MSNVVQNLIDPLLERFSFKGGEGKKQAAIDDMVHALVGYTDDNLHEAAKYIRETRTFLSMPTPGDVRQVLIKLADEKKKNTSRHTKAADDGGTGWRTSDSGMQWFRIEKGSKEWSAWMESYRVNGKRKLADYLDAGVDCHFVPTQFPPTARKPYAEAS